MKNNKLQNGLLILLTAGLIGSTAMGTMSLRQVSDLKASIKELSVKTKEDDIIIADEYEIKSTKHISDAYKKGNDSKLKEKEKETLKQAKKVLSKIIKEHMTAYDKEKAVYDWMAKNITVDDGSMTVIPTAEKTSDHPLGVLQQKKAVCVGYATTFRLFMELLDIPCHVIHNADAYHSWNLVQLDDEWYHVDVYSDAGNGNYSHFNISDSQQTSNGVVWDTEFFPAATGIKYNMVYQKKEELTDIYKIPARVRKAVESGETLLGLSFQNDLTEVDQKVVLEMINSLQCIISGTEQYSALTLNTDWIDINGKQILGVYFATLKAEEPVEPIPVKQVKKMNRAMKEAFKSSKFNLEYLEENMETN